MDKKVSYFLLFIALSLLININYAQLGEVAGQLNFNVNLSSSQTQQMIIINSGKTNLQYEVFAPTLQMIANTTTPTITVSPINGTLRPYEQQTINITVYMPGGDKPG